MSEGGRAVTAGQRRARLAIRHRLAPAHHADDVAGVAGSLLALHGTDPASVYLAAWARTSPAGSEAVERALYEDKTLVRMLGMRRTMFVVPTELAPVIQAGCTDQIAERLRRQLVQQIRQSGIADDADGWLKEVGEATVAALAERGSATGAELSKAEPRLREQITYAEGKTYGGPANVSTRVLMLLSAEGHIVRGRPRGGWTSSQFQWSPAGAWLGAAAGESLPPDAARAELARRWLHAFGPAPLADLQWWTGWPGGQVKAAVAQLRTTEVDLAGTPGVVLAGDDDFGGEGAQVQPWAALLPALDPTAMGWRERGWYLGEHGPALFDRSGNIGPTVWWDGQIVGGWAQRRDGEIAVRLLADTGTAAAAAIGERAERLREWLGPVRVTPRFRTPLERELSA